MYIEEKGWDSEETTNLDVLQIKIPSSGIHLFLTSVNSSTELTRDIWSFESHTGQFLKCKPTRNVPSRPDSSWVTMQTRGRTYLWSCFSTVDSNASFDTNNTLLYYQFNSIIVQPNLRILKILTFFSIAIYSTFLYS